MHEEDRDEDAEADRLELAPEVRVGHRAVGVGEREDRAGRERAEDHLEPELLRGGGEADEQDERAAHADLGRRVLQPQQVGADRARALRAAHDREHDRARRPSSAPIRTSVAPAPPSPVKNSDSRMIAAKSAIEPPAMTSWPSVESLAGVLEHRDQHAERRGASGMIATSSGVSTSPPRSSASATATAIANDSA